MPAPDIQPINAGPHEDATADFYATLNDPKRWIIKKGVPVFKSHKRTDPATGKLIEVDTPKLYRIAQNMQTMERQGGVPIRMTLGHTEPGKPETHQPPVGGYYRNARVQPFGPKGEPAIVVDEWLDPQYQAQRKNFPYRSSEYYDDTEQITGVALLTRDPFLDLGVVAYGTDRSFVAYTKSAPGMVQYSNDGRPHTGYRLVLGETQYAGANQYPKPWGPQSTGQQMNNSRYSETPYSAPWPGPAYQPHKIGHQHTSGGAIYSDQGRNRRVMRSAAPQANYDDTDMFSDRSLDDVRNAGRSSGGRSLGNFDFNNSGSAQRMPQSEPDFPEYESDTGGYGGIGSKIRPESEDYSRSRNSRYSQQGNRMNGRGRAGRYADDGMAGAAMSGDPLQTVYTCLSQAVEALQGMMEGQAGGPGTPPPGPFPEQGGPGGPPPGGPGGPGGMPPEEDEDMVPNSRYGRNAQYANQLRRPGQRPQLSQRPQNYGEPQMQPRGDRRYARYDRAGGAPASVPTPTPTRSPAAPGARTISGLPVGYAMEQDQLRYELRQANDALRVLYYERDVADTEACAAEIGRLAAEGFAVGEYEVTELKNKPRDQRPAYIQHIVSRYQKVGQGLPPLAYGDPTPGPAANTNRPMTREEMEQALKIANGSNDPNAFTEAVRYIRSGGAQPTPYGPAFTGNPGYGAPQYGNPAEARVEANLNGMGNPFAG